MHSSWPPPRHIFSCAEARLSYASLHLTIPFCCHCSSYLEYFWLPSLNVCSRTLCLICFHSTRLPPDAQRNREAWQMLCQNILPNLFLPSLYVSIASLKLKNVQATVSHKVHKAPFEQFHKQASLCTGRDDRRFVFVQQGSNKSQL